MVETAVTHDVLESSNEMGESRDVSIHKKAMRLIGDYSNTIEALNRMAERRQKLYAERHEAISQYLVPIVVNKGNDPWLAEIEACGKALELLWDRRRCEISWQDDTIRTTVPKGFQRAQKAEVRT